MDNISKSWQIFLCRAFVREFFSKWTLIYAIPAAILLKWTAFSKKCPECATYLQPHLQSILGEIKMDPFPLAVILFLGWIIIAIGKITCRQAKELTPVIEPKFSGLNGGIVKTREVAQVVVVINGQQQLIQQQYYATWVRVKVNLLSNKTANNCAAFIVGISREDNGVSVLAPLYDSIQLPWALVGPGEINIHHNIPRHFDVIKSTEVGKKIEVCGAAPFTLDGFFDLHGVYCFKVAVVSNGIPTHYSFKVKWDGNWDKIEEVP